MWKTRELKFPQLSIEWKKARHGVLTGSIVGKIMPSKTGKLPDVSEMLCKKAAEHMAQKDESKPIPKANSEWGHEWEPFAANAYADETGLELYEPSLIQSDFEELVASSPDRITENGRRVIEIKCPMTMAKHLSYIEKSPATNMWSTSAEKCYYWQVRHHMLCTRIKRCDWVSYNNEFAPHPIFIDTVEWDEVEMATMQEVCENFVKKMKQLCKRTLNYGK
jgi:putative phage-type endonuclease